MNIPNEDRFMKNDLYDAADRTGQTLVLVTGATGNVGRNVVSQLLDRDIRVRG
jgi:FlaA1/EpsC-like NDP-sugar epimerase